MKREELVKNLKELGKGTGRARKLIDILEHGEKFSYEDTRYLDNLSDRVWRRNPELGAIYKLAGAVSYDALARESKSFYNYRDAYFAYGKAAKNFELASEMGNKEGYNELAIRCRVRAIFIIDDLIKRNIALKKWSKARELGKDLNFEKEHLWELSDRL